MTRKKSSPRRRSGATVFIVSLLLQWIPAVAGMMMSGGVVWVAKNYPCGARDPRLRGAWSRDRDLKV